MSAWKLRPDRASAIIVTVLFLIASLFWSVQLTPRDASAAFYLLPTRAWEMLAGGLIFFLNSKQLLKTQYRRVLETVGLVLIITSVIIFDSSSNWPGWRALLPVTGAMLVLLAARSVSLWTGNMLTQWVGTRSYSIYLWHWPIAVALTYTGLKSEPVAIITGLLLTLFLGNLSYRFVETNALVYFSGARSRSKIGIIGIFLIAAIPGTAVRLADGVKNRISPQLSGEMEIARSAADDINPRRKDCHPSEGGISPSCIHGDPVPGVVLIGDSHANAVASGLLAAMPLGTGGVMEWSYSGCPTIQGAERIGDETKKKCVPFFGWIIDRLETVPSTVPIVVVNRTSAYALGSNEPGEFMNKPMVYFQNNIGGSEDSFIAKYSQKLTDSVCLLARKHVVHLVRPIPEMGINVPKKMARGLMFGDNREISISEEEYRRRHAQILDAQDAARKRCGVKILDPLPYLCRDGRCFGAKQGRPIYYDDDHLNESGNKLLVPMFAEIFLKS